MSYTRVNWNSTTTYVSNENLNVMDKGIKELDTNVGDVTTLTTTAKTVVPAINELKTGLKDVNNNLAQASFSIIAKPNCTTTQQNCKKIGKIIHIACSIKTTNTATGWVELATIPDGCRPPVQSEVVCTQDNTTDFFQLFYGIDGTISINTTRSLANDKNIVIDFMYFAA